MGKVAMKKILHVGLWWPTLHKDSQVYCRGFGACQGIGRPSWRDELPLNLKISL